MSKKALLAICALATTGLVGATVVKAEHYRRRNSGHYLARSVLRKGIRSYGGVRGAAVATGDKILQDCSVISFRHQINRTERDLMNPPGTAKKLLRTVRYSGRIVAEAFDSLLTPPELRAKANIRNT